MIRTERGGECNLIQRLYSQIDLIELKGMHFNHDFYVVLGKQYRTENRKTSLKQMNNKKHWLIYIKIMCWLPVQAFSVRYYLPTTT